MIAQANELKRAVADVVQFVNAHSGRASVTLRFQPDYASDEVDFVANSATLSGENFLFTAGFQTYGGSIAELAEIKANVIVH